MADEEKTHPADHPASEPASARSESGSESEVVAQTASGEGDGQDAPSARSGEADDDAEGGLDPQLIGLCVLLWVVALGIFAFRWTDMRVDYHLGNLRETIHAEGRLDPASVEALLDMTDSGVLEHLVAELNDPMQRDQLYRVAVLRVVGRIAAPAAQEVVRTACRDHDANVRANAYAMVRDQAEADPSLRERALELLRAGADGDGAAFSRAHAANHLARLGGPAEAWPAIRALRDLTPELVPVLGPALVDTLRQVSGKTEEEQLPYTPGEPASDEQLRAWEDWYREAGGTVPPGESLDEVRARAAAEQEQAEGPSGPAASGGPEEPPVAEASGAR